MSEKNTVTREQALTNAIAHLSQTGGDPEVMAVLEHMLAQLRKAKAKAGATVSKTKDANRALAVELHRVCGDAPFTAANAVGLLPTVLTPQKAVAILNAGIADGLFTRGYVKGRALFTAVR